MTTLAKAGRYEVVGELGRGAMGVVYKAVDPVIGRNVAVKTIKLSEEGTGLSRPELLSRFQTEARAAGLLTHPNIVVVFDAGEEDGLYYITMELVEGKSLQALLDSGQAFPLPRVLRIMDQTCSALQFAHENNVVHRDVKPANIMLTPDDTVKVTDFGTAKILQFGTVQQTAHVMGTPSYMSPEQVKGKAVDGRSDIFSLGVMLYEMVTGEKPFPGQNITTVIYKIVNEEPIPPRQINTSVHPGVSAVVMRALAKDPEIRYQSCREMLEDLRNYRGISSEGGNPDATMISGVPALGGAFQQGGGHPTRNANSDDFSTVAAARSLANRTPNPSQTPALRRTDSFTPPPQPKKKGIVGTIFAAMLLIAVIAYGVIKLRPVFDDARQRHDVAATPPNDATSAANGGSSVPPSGADAPGSSAPSGSQNADATPKDKAADSTAAPQVALTGAKVKEVEPEKANSKKFESGLSPKATEYKGQIEQMIIDRGLTGRARVQAFGNTLVLAGKLRPGEHGDVLKFLRNAPAEIRVVDHIGDDESAVAPSSAPNGNSESDNNVPSPGRGAIHVVTDVAGALAILHGPAGRVLNQCQTPCTFNNLFPAQYSLEVNKEGYGSVQTALQVKRGLISNQSLSLESLAKGLFISSRPKGAEIFINDAKAGETPATLPLAPGQYKVSLRLPGYRFYSETVQVKDNIQTQLDAHLIEESGSQRVAFIQVVSNPNGAEILVDGVDTGKLTPSRVELTAGRHIITMVMKGFKPVKRTVDVSEGGTASLQEALETK